MRRFPLRPPLLGLLAAALLTGLGSHLAAAFRPLPARSAAAPPPQSGDWYLDISRPGRPVRIAVPDFTVASPTPETAAPTMAPTMAPEEPDREAPAAAEPGAETAAATLSEVLWNDIAYAGVYRLLPKRFYRIAEEGSPDGVLDYYQWESVGADILVRGNARIEAGRLVVEVRLHAVRARESVFARRYTAGADAARSLAHRIADDLLLQAGGYLGVARTRIAFATTRRQQRSKEIYLMDYDGFGQRPVTANGSLNITPTWSPDGRALSYISYREGAPALYLAFLYQGRGEKLVGDHQSFTPAWSPDGEWIAFTSNRDGQSEIYLAAVDGSELRRLTDHQAIDIAPTWSPNGRTLAFTSDRTGAPQIYTMDRDGLNLRRVSFEGSYNDSPAWSPSRQRSELAYASRIERGPFDIVVHDFSTRQTRQLTTGRGSNESPSWAPNGLHLVFTSNRTGSEQIFAMNADGSNLRRLTEEGANTMPRWGNPPAAPE